MTDNLDVLPLLHVVTVDPTSNGGILVHGHLDHWKDLAGSLWFWLWPSDTEAIIPSVDKLDELTGEVSLLIDKEDVRDTIRSDVSLHWLIPAHQAYHVSMILQGKWSKRELKAQDAVHFKQDQAHGWTRVDMPLPEGAVQTGVQAGGWDHEHCEICNGRISEDDYSFGYVDEREHWLCPPCYERWAVPRSLVFLAPK